MRQLLFLAALLMALLALGSGCGDDEKTPTGGGGGDTLDPEPLPGDTNDPTFKLVDSTFEGVMYDWFDQSWGLAFALMDSMSGQASGFGRKLPTASLNTAPQLDITITAILSFEYTESGWFVFEFQARATDITDPPDILITGIDSIQLLLDGVPLDTLDSAVPDVMKTHAHFGWWRSYIEEGYSNQQLDLAFGDYTFYVINATNSDTVMNFWMDDSGSYTLQIVSNTVAQDLLISPFVFEGEGCPESGTIEVSANTHLGCAGPCTGWFEEINTDGNWTVVVTFTGNDSASVEYSDGTTVWTMTGECD